MCIVHMQLQQRPDISPSPENLQKYYERDSQRMKAHEKFAAYFDFSGVYVAYADPATAQTFNGITQKVTGSLQNYDLYSLANSKIEQLSSGDLQSAAQIFERLHDPAAQGQLYAPIEQALHKIVADDRSALLVTDYEEYTPATRYTNRPMPHPTLKSGSSAARRSPFCDRLYGGKSAQALVLHRV